MEYKEALKKVQARKPKGNFLVVTIGYDTKMILPHSDGLAFIAAMSNAETLYTPYSAKHYIGPLDRDKMTFTQMSQHEYEQYKIAALLNIDVKEVKEMSESLEP